MTVALSITYHDPPGRLAQQIQRVLPVLKQVFGGLAIRASHGAWQPSLDLFERAGALVAQGPAREVAERFRLGQARREAVALALNLSCPFILHCDGDRLLHWAERYPDELARAARRVADFDFTVIGRTPRAFDSHPRVQRETEIIVNRVFASVSGRAWDVTAATRGMSRQAAEAILAGCADVELSTDVSWTLFLQQQGHFKLGYIETDGMEFETGDRHADRIALAGGHAQWMRQLDADPRNWAHRLDMARIEVEGLLPYWNQAGPA